MNISFQTLWKTERRFIGLSKQRLTYSKNLIIGHLSLNSVRNKFSSLQQTVLSKTDILLLSETNIDNSFPDPQFFAESFEMYLKERTKTRGALLLYEDENLPGKIINSYKFKGNSEIILFEFIVAQYMKTLFYLAISICPQKTFI